MPLVLQCPQCGQRLSVPDQAAGRVVRCTCGQTLQVPAAAGTGYAGQPSAAGPSTAPGTPQTSGGEPAVQGNVPPGWSAVYQQMIQQQQALAQQGYPAAYPTAAYPQQGGYPAVPYPAQGGYPAGQYPQAGQPQGWPQPAAYPPGQQQPAAPQAPSAWAGIPVMPGGQPGVPTYPPTSVPPGQAWPGGQAGQYRQPGHPGQMPPPGLPGQPGEIAPLIAAPSKPKKGHTSRADLDAPLEMPTDVGPSMPSEPSAKTAAPTDVATPKTADWLASLPENYVPEMVVADDRNPAKAAPPGTAGTGPVAAGMGPAAPGAGYGGAGVYGMSSPVPTSPQPAPLGQWIAQELTQPAKPMAASWNPAAGGVVEELPPLRGRLFGGRRRYRKASEGIKRGPSPLIRVLVAIPLLVFGTLHAIAGGVASVSVIVSIVGGIMKIIQESRTVDPFGFGIALLVFSVIFMFALATAFGGAKCLSGALGLLRNVRRGATDAATGSGTLMAMSLINLFFQFVFLGIIQEMDVSKLNEQAINVLRLIEAFSWILIWSQIIQASLYFLILLWCNTAGKRIPE